MFLKGNCNAKLREKTKFKYLHYIKKQVSFFNVLLHNEYHYTSFSTKVDILCSVLMTNVDNFYELFPRMRLIFCIFSIVDLPSADDL